MSTTAELLNVLEDTAALLQKTQVNLKKCPKSRLTKGYIDARIKCIEQYWITFKETHRQLVKITSKEQKQTIKYFINEDFFVYEDLYLVLLADLQDLLLTINAAHAPSTSSKNNSFTNITSNDQLVRLPRIQLPSFSGKYEDWPTFQDLFISLVHSNTAISDVQKLHYLKSSVTGEAETLLKPMQITQSNYEKAWTVLKARYGNKKMIVNSVLKKFCNQKKISTQSANQIKNLLDVTTDCLNNLQNLNISLNSWDPIIIFLVIQKLDPESHKEWEQAAYTKDEDKLPTWNDLKEFLQSRYRTLELVMATSPSGTRDKPIRESSHLVTAATTTSPSPTDRTCVLCKEKHTLCHCKNFTKLQPAERSEYVQTNKLCFNCLAPGHSAYQCKLKMSCRLCSRRHHTLLHRNQDSASSGQTEDSKQPKAAHNNVEEKEEIVNTTIASHYSTKQSTSTALLATATVLSRNEHNHTVVLRALVDQGSQASFISEKATQLLKLTRQTAKGSIIGVGSTRTNVNHMVQLRISSRWNSNFEINIQAYVMGKQLTTKIPSKAVTVTHWPHLEGLNLADPDFDKPGPIDLLLGVKEYAQIVQQQLIKGPPGSPCAQETNLGWILFGEIKSELQEESFLVLHQQIDVNNMLKTFWEIDTEKKRKLTKEEKLCETIFEDTHARTKEGRYIVKLPFKSENPVSPEGNTKEIARNRLLQLERRFRKAPTLKENYQKAMQEYLKSNYMEEIPENETNKKSVYLPHHAVIRDDKESSKTRIVFDASAKGSNHVSLNDELLVGPQLQDDLRDIVMRSRLYRVCYACDIQKMYLQVLLYKEDADRYQRLLWREEESDPIKEYRMLRVTFGTASAPYLAVKTLHQVVEDESKCYTKAARVIKADFYMDDLISGDDTVEEAMQTAQEVDKVLQKGGFILSKWSSNSTEFMQSIEATKRTKRVHLDFKLDGTVQALGLIWNLGTDQFQYKINLPQMIDNVTKRSILSDIQKLFDPLGWIAPSLILAKMLIQRLWLEKVGWDDKLSQNLVDEWMTLREDIGEAKEVYIDRWLGTLSLDIETVEVHGFSDASTRAYAAVAYIRVLKQDGSVSTKLLAAKTKVAPLRTVSLPRLELCGALLLSKLLKQIENAMRIPTSNIYAWTDSSIVLAWLSGDPHRWKTFVANRVVEIVENVNNNRWFHVSSEDNPADIGSRGMLLVDLKNSDLWWKGPAWLSETEIRLNKENTSTDLEMKRDTVHVNLKLGHEESITLQFKECDNLKELIKVITYCRRFLNFKRSLENLGRSFTTHELEETLKKCIALVQQEEFKDDIERLRENKAVKRESKIKTLNPYLDEDCILRVGGRLRNANLDEQVKHPIIVGNKNNLVPLIIADAHTRTLHGGVQLMLSYISSKYWILRVKALVKSCIHKCLVCARLRARSRIPVMGDLPKARVTPARAFLHTGVDFAGPFQIQTSKGRGIRTQKAYICVFICMSTKAMHLELVGDLSSEAFIAAFKRFVSRRGKCSDIWSDQGRNFVGANKELMHAWKEANLVFEGDISNTLALEGTQWHYIPAYSPNFGGLWEAGVKSVKTHLKRVLTTNLTYEEMTTVLCQIEACLNSRPLCPIDDKDPDCLEVLTPGHFLIGEAPIVVPSPDFKDTKIHCLSRWQYTQKLLGDFWRRWQREYLTRLQQRPIWLKKSEEFKHGDIVLIKSDGLPPGKFSLGRVVNKHPGDDGITRVYSIKSGNSVVKRCVSKLCPLPIATD